MKNVSQERKIAKKIQKHLSEYESKKIPYQKMKALIINESLKSSISDFYKTINISSSHKDIKNVFEAYKKEINENLEDNNQTAYLNNAGISEFLDEDLDSDSNEDFDEGSFSDSDIENFAINPVTKNNGNKVSDIDLGKTHSDLNVNECDQINENLVNDDYLVDVGSNEFNSVNEEDEMDSPLDNATNDSTLDNDYAIYDFEDSYLMDEPLDEQDEEDIEDEDEENEEDIEDEDEIKVDSWEDLNSKDDWDDQRHDDDDLYDENGNFIDELKDYMKEADEKEVDYVDKPTLFADLVSVENNMSDAFNSLYPYKFQYIDDPRIKKSLRELRLNISDTLNKITSLISMVGLEKDIVTH